MAMEAPAWVMYLTTKSFKRKTRSCPRTLGTMAASLESLLLALISSTDVSRRHPYRPARRRRKQKNTMALTKRRDLRSHMEKRVRALRRLVPNGESMELHGLFMEATDYIACLQARIKAMQTMVKVLSDGSGKATRKASNNN